MGSDFIKGASWIDAEIDGAGFGDARLGERLRKLMSQLDSALGQPIPLACEDWANTKAAYRFLANASVNEGPILAGHFRATARRAAANDELMGSTRSRPKWLRLLSQVTTGSRSPMATGQSWR